MKRASAFSVFQTNKKKGDGKNKSRPPSGIEQPEFLRRSHSSQSVSKKEHGSASRGKRFLNALKSGSIRESIRMSGKKLKASSLTSINKDSPFASFDQISLNGSKNSGQKTKPKRKSKEQAVETTPVTRKSPGNTKLSQKDKVPLPLPRKLSKVSPKEKSPSTNKSTALISDSGIMTASGSKRKAKKMIEEESSSNGDEVIRKKRKMANESSKIQEVALNGSGDSLPYMYDSSLEASKMFECIIHPVKTDRFFNELWEKKPLLVKRHIADYNRGWFSTAEFDKILRLENVQWGVNLDATSFVDNNRETHNQSGRAYAAVVWDMYQAGCSMRLLNPQTYSRNVWKVLSVLQEYFGCCVGANVYLTPPGTQGFAPHFDDIEAFIIQLEGKKHWRLYSPRTDDEVLPRFSSGNFSQTDMGEPILDTVLEAGDLLYFPRGTIHQANATEEHSLHITVSCYQLNSWGDLLLKLLPTAVQVALEENSEFRTGLPRDYLNYMGVVHSERELPERKVFHDKVKSLLDAMMDSLPLDAACDQMGKQFIHDTLPPVLSEGEKMCSINGAGEKWDGSLKRVLGVSEIQPDTEIKLLRKNNIRLLTEDDKVRVYYNTENARVYRGFEPNYFEVTSEMAQAIECLIHNYPEFMTVENLPLDSVSDQINVASVMYERGLLITAMPLQTTFDEPGDGSDDDDL